MRKIVVALVWLALSIVPVVSAQSGNGTLRGKVVDELGAPMPGVTVTASRSVGTAIVEPPAELRMLAMGQLSLQTVRPRRADCRGRPPV
jgi:hypothetical protein